MSKFNRNDSKSIGKTTYTSTGGNEVRVTGHGRSTSYETLTRTKLRFNQGK